MPKLEMRITKNKRPSYTDNGWTHSAVLRHGSPVGRGYPELVRFEGSIILLRNVHRDTAQGNRRDNPGFDRDVWYFTIGNFINLIPRTDTVIPENIGGSDEEDEEE